MSKTASPLVRTSAGQSSTLAVSAFEKRLITVASGKGGVGKTWFSITLAHALALAGQSVLLFDGDLGLANVDIQLGINPERDLASVVTGTSQLSGAITRYSDGSARPARFDVLAGQSGSGALSRLGREALVSLRQDLAQQAQGYDRVILDLGAGLDHSVTVLADHAGLCLVVVTPEPTSITDAYAFIKLRRRRDPNADVRLVVNNAASRKEGEQTAATLSKACQNFLHFTPQLAGVVRRDRHVPEAIRAQVPLLSRSPDAPAAQDVEVLARGLLAAATSLTRD